MTPIDTMDVSQTSVVSGVSKLKLSESLNRADAIKALMPNDTAAVMIISTRIAKIHTSSCVCTIGFRTARRMNVISATPVTP